MSILAVWYVIDIPHVMNVRMESVAIVPHFFFLLQFTAISGSSGPSQSTMFGSKGWATPDSSAFSRSFASWFTMEAVSEGVDFDSPSLIAFSLTALSDCDFADIKEVEEVGRGVAEAVSIEGVCPASSALVCSSDELGSD